MNTTLFAYLRLMRPANILTAITNILLGFAASGSVVKIYVENTSYYRFIHLEELFFLILSTIGLYGGGVVMNDVFDYQLDKKERPERPLPSGKASLQGAILLGSILLLCGVISAFFASLISGLIALFIALLALLYDAWGKHQDWFGPFNMGLCRGLNVLLGMSVEIAGMERFWYLALIPLAYIASITLVSRGEVEGGNRNNIQLAGMMYGLIVVAVLAFEWIPLFKILECIPFLLLFVAMIFPPLLKAHRNPQPVQIRKAVRAGILSLILMDATISAGFAGWQYGVMVLIFLPFSLGLARLFAVT